MFCLLTKTKLDLLKYNLRICMYEFPGVDWPYSVTAPVEKYAEDK